MDYFAQEAITENSSAIFHISTREILPALTVFLIFPGCAIPWLQQRAL